MSSPNRKKQNKVILGTAPVSCMLLGFQAFMGVKFSCPCKYGWSQGISLAILIVPALSALLMMSVLLKFAEVKDGQSEKLEKRGTCEHWFYWMIRCIPSLIWGCIFFIDGDYFACGVTFYNGTYTCYQTHNTKCVSWCKPGPIHEQHTAYVNAQDMINISKSIGYILAFLSCCIICFTMRMSKDNNRSRTSKRQKLESRVYDAATETLQPTPQSE